MRQHLSDPARATGPARRHDAPGGDHADGRHPHGQGLGTGTTPCQAPGRLLAPPSQAASRPPPSSTARAPGPLRAWSWPPGPRRVPRSRWAPLRRPPTSSRPGPPTGRATRAPSRPERPSGSRSSRTGQRHQGEGHLGDEEQPRAPSGARSARPPRPAPASSRTVTASTSPSVDEGKDRGKARVMLDGKAVASLDLYAKATTAKQVICSVSFPSAGKHTHRPRGPRQEEPQGQGHPRGPRRLPGPDAIGGAAASARPSAAPAAHRQSDRSGVGHLALPATVSSVVKSSVSTVGV